jgi:glycosyltransferase involved in cell wall biosynthesis
LEEDILRKVDSCFALSEPLMQTRKVKSGENHFLPMGVDIDLFCQPGLPIPPELHAIKKPIAGFFGQIGSYVDVDLIVQCAKAYPQVSFVVIGRPHPQVNLSVFTQASNIVFLGEIPYDKMPQYAQAFNIGLNPRVLNKLSLAMNPLKLLEYLSIGMPVVSTDLPAVRRFKDFVNIAETKEHFVELIGTALQDTSEEKREARRKIAQQYSWKSIVQHVSEIIVRIDAAKKIKH